MIILAKEAALITQSSTDVLAEIIKDFPLDRIKEVALSKGYTEDEAIHIANELKREFKTKADKLDS